MYLLKKNSCISGSMFKPMFKGQLYCNKSYMNEVSLSLLFSLTIFTFFSPNLVLNLSDHPLLMINGSVSLVARVPLLFGSMLSGATHCRQSKHVFPSNLLPTNLVPFPS